MKMCNENVFTEMYLVFLLFCGVLAVDLDESITVNKPVIRTEVPTAYSTGSVRCFCNLPACVLTSYMCKSSGGGCFSDLYHHSSPQAVYRGRHGCLELLPENKRDWCQRNPNGNQHPMRRKNAHPKSLVHCCYHDMCNHADDPQTKNLINDTTLENILHEDNRPVEPQMDNGYNNADVWFKAAIIAVPICGAVILFVLIALAIKILRSESYQNGNYKLGTTYQPPIDKNNCSKLHEHYHTSQHLLRKDIIHPSHNQIYANHIEDLRNSRTPIIISKDINNKNLSKINYFHGNEYNLLPPNPQIFEVHKCYENKSGFITNNPESCKNTNINRNSTQEVGYCNPSTDNKNDSNENIA